MPLLVLYVYGIVRLVSQNLIYDLGYGARGLILTALLQASIPISTLAIDHANFIELVLDKRHIARLIVFRALACFLVLC